MEKQKPFWKTNEHPILGYAYLGVAKIKCTKRQKERQREQYALNKK